MSQIQKIQSTESKDMMITSLKHKKYNTIDFQKRKQLIRRVIKDGEKLKEVSKSLNIKLSTSKFILKIFKRQGRIFKKKSQGPFDDTDSQIIQLKETLEENAKKNMAVTQYIYVPVYYPVYIEKQSNGTFHYAAQQPFLNPNLTYNF